MSDKKNSMFGIMSFAAIVCLICSLVVSTAAVSLRKTQQQNAANEKKLNILVAAGLAQPGQKLSAEQIADEYKKVIPLVVNLKTGLLDTSKNPQTYDMYAAAQNPDESQALSPDPAGIKRIANDGSAYVVINGDQIERVVLPIQGYGLWSTMYGFTSLSLADNTQKITGITFYQQGETPGLGAKITLPSWQAKWNGVLPYDAQGNPDVVLSKNRDPSQKNQVDALAGATLTSNGVQHLMNFWLGNQGYKAFIDNLQQGKITISEMHNALQSTSQLTQEGKS